MLTYLLALSHKYILRREKRNLKCKLHPDNQLLTLRILSLSSKAYSVKERFFIKFEKEQELSL